jgi:outer membrane protein OmpA-like peptidoglycan-associated protein/tRNA threonylcarbamoyladenosine modification (KEOPS) complex  Pcc1 subunit
MMDFELAAAPNGKSFAIAYRDYSAGKSYVHTGTVVSGDVVWSSRTAVFGTSGASLSPEITYSANSNKLMAYALQRQGANYWFDIVTISAAIDATTGEPTWDASTIFIPTPVVSDAEDVEWSPVITLSADGKSGVAVSSREVYGVVGKMSIQNSFYSCSGDPEVCSWTETVDLTSTSDYAYSPNAVMASDGLSAFVFWKNNSGNIVSKTATYASSTWSWSGSTATIPTVGSEDYLDFAYSHDRTKLVIAWSSSNTIYTNTSLDFGATWLTAKEHGTAAAGATTIPSVDISDGASPVIVVMWGVSGKAKAMAGRVSGGAIDWGTATEFGSTSGFWSSIKIKGDGSSALASWGSQPSYSSTLTFEPPSSDSSLSSLAFSSGTLSPAFATGTTSYSSSVAYSVSSVTITATKSHVGATIQYRLGTSGSFSTLVSGTSSVSLAVGANTVEVKVTAEDTTTTTYSTVITRSAAATNANLSSLSFSAGTLSPAFDGATTSYTTSVPYSSTSVTITGSKSDSNATVEYRLGTSGAFTTLVSGTSSVLLAVGANTVEVKVTAEDGTTTKTYSTEITREPLSSDANLSALSFSSGSLSPAFASGTTSYTASVSYSTTSVIISATKSNAGATVEYRLGTSGGFSTLVSGTSSVSLAVGANTVEVRVTAEDSTTMTYSTEITRSTASSDSTLSALSFSSGSLSPSFSSATTSYTSTVPYSASSVTISATKGQSGATVEYRLGTSGSFTTLDSGTSSVALVEGANTVEIRVTAENGSTTTYTVVITRSPEIVDEEDPIISGPGGTPIEVEEDQNTITTLSANEDVEWSIVSVIRNGVDVSELFAISSNGVLTFPGGATIGTYVITIRATDGADNQSTITFTVIVNPKDVTPPVITNPVEEITVPIGTEKILTLQANEDVEWSVELATRDGVDVSGMFTMSGNGGLYFLGGAQAGTYEITVKATDIGGNFVSITFTVIVDGDPTKEPVVEIIVDADGNVTIVVSDPNGETTTSSITDTDKPVSVSIVNGKLVVNDPTFSGVVSVTIEVQNQSGFKTSVTLSLTVKPNLPSGVKIKMNKTKKKANQVAGSNVQLSWQAVSNATGYQILIGGKVVGTTSSTNFELTNFLFNRPISVIALGNDGTASNAVTIEATLSSVKIGNVNFGFNSWKLSSKAKNVLKKVVKLVKRSDIDIVVLQGHTDILGSKWSARWLSKKRGEVAMKFLQMRLKGLGIKFKVVALGSADPVASNKNAKGRALNRRVDILLP